ncbi:DNA alkylation repair protein [Parasporobacterium paucivorans]|uniref:3-methyladenine DNA glycosylase AlkD n=1 Tax=Parasporobacterium paucivorans DSM 15970 TaxID=1122934 RepID=A0A1M6F7T3_9FIRM|nr:DNA alkylation repair protein [Parasporobacterium paucivorans]SHI93767.1 3-methyladenine DNA glycosylase AlkD [Parasporobacterium paucivorans DSM 15970]
MNFICKKWTNDNYNVFLAFLLNKQDSQYRQFMEKLLPGVSNLIGIRMPVLHEAAKQIAKGDVLSFLSVARDTNYEEVLVQGLVIGRYKTDYQEFMVLFANHIDKINSWGACDSFCSGLKNFGNHKEDFFGEIPGFLKSENVWHIRIGLVMMIYYYLDDIYIEEVLRLCDHVSDENYYVKMAQAWLISSACTKYPSQTLMYLENSTGLDIWTYNKSLQKIRESRKVSDETKSRIRMLKKLNQREIS